MDFGPELTFDPGHFCTSIRKFFQMRRAGKGFDALNLVLHFVLPVLF